MVIVCPSCRAENEAPDWIKPGQKIRCPYCNTKFPYSPELVVSAEESVSVPEDPKVEEPAPAASPSEPAAPETPVPVPEDPKVEEPAPAASSLLGLTGVRSSHGIPKGRIFSDSVNLYDDEARVAFDYLRNAAERIIAEEDANAVKMKKAEEDIKNAQADIGKAREQVATLEKSLTKAREDKASAETALSIAIKDAKIGFGLVFGGAALAIVCIAGGIALNLAAIGFGVGALGLVPIGLGVVKVKSANARKLTEQDALARAKQLIEEKEGALEDALHRLAADEKTLAEQEQTRRGIEEEFRAIKRDYTISKLGIAYVPVATEVPFEGKSFILDDTQKTENSEFELYQINQQDAFIETLTSLKARAGAAPVAETGESPESVQATDLVPSFETVQLHDYMGGMDRDLRAMTYFLKDLTKTSVSLPVIAPKGDHAKFLDEFCTVDTGNHPVLNVFDNSFYASDLATFEKMNELKKKMTFSDKNLDDVLQDFILEIAENVQYLGRAKIASIGRVLSVCGDTLLNTFKASYNHYSPELAKEEIERLQQEDFAFQVNSESVGIKPFLLSSGSKVRYDAVSENWVADDGTRVAAPFGIHQIQEEIISPLVQNLLRETRIERLKIYNNIVDQKINYVKEWQKEVDDFYGRGRAEGNDIINQMQVVLGDFTGAYLHYQSLLKTERDLAKGDTQAAVEIDIGDNAEGETVASFKQQADAIEAQKNEFKDYIERLQDEIERKASSFSYTRDHEASLRDTHAKEAVMSLLAVDQLDERRKALLAANPFIAENAKLPPPATVHEEMLYGKVAKNLPGVASQLVESIELDARNTFFAESADVPVEQAAVAGDSLSDGRESAKTEPGTAADAGLTDASAANEGVEETAGEDLAAEGAEEAPSDSVAEAKNPEGEEDAKVGENVESVDGSMDGGEEAEDKEV